MHVTVQLTSCTFKVIIVYARMVIILIIRAKFVRKYVVMEFMCKRKVVMMVIWIEEMDVKIIVRSKIISFAKTSVINLQHAN